MGLDVEAGLIGYAAGRLPLLAHALRATRFLDRLAHQSLSQLDASLLWRVGIERVTELRAVLISLRASAQ